MTDCKMIDGNLALKLAGKGNVYIRSIMPLSEEDDDDHLVDMGISPWKVEAETQEKESDTHQKSKPLGAEQQHSNCSMNANCKTVIQNYMVKFLEFLVINDIFMTWV